MVTKESQYKTKIPKAYRTTKTKDKNKSIDGDRRKTCPVCGKRNQFYVYAKPQPINEHDPNLYYVSKCHSCNYIHLVPIGGNQE